MKQTQEWKVPESWMLAAANLYLGTITVCSNGGEADHKCTCVEPESSGTYGPRMFKLTIERTLPNTTIVTP